EAGRVKIDERLLADCEGRLAAARERDGVTKERTCAPSSPTDADAPPLLQPNPAAQLATAHHRKIVEGHLLTRAMLHDSEPAGHIVGVMRVPGPDADDFV